MFFLSNENLSLASNIYFDGIQNYTFLYSITSEQSRRFIDWKIRREREKFFDRDSSGEIYSSRREVGECNARRRELHRCEILSRNFGKNNRAIYVHEFAAR